MYNPSLPCATSYQYSLISPSMTLFWSKSTITSLNVSFQWRFHQKSKLVSQFCWLSNIYWKMDICAHSDLYLKLIRTHTHRGILWLVGSVWERRVQQSQTGHRKRPDWTNQQQQSTNPISQTHRLCSRKAKFSWTENKSQEMRLCLITKKLPGHQAYCAHTIVLRLMKLSLHQECLFRLAEKQCQKKYPVK